MNYTEFEFNVLPLEPGLELLLAELSQFKFEGFIESKESLKAYIQTKKLNFDFTQSSIFSNKDFVIGVSKKNIKSKNWNIVWEKNIKPVIINQDCIVQTSYVEINNKFKYSIIINPKMSFGTAHHETTKLMLQQMFNLKLKNKSLLDIGCGTGILSILAYKLGASSIVGIDTDSWAIQNSCENLEVNGCSNIVVKQGTVNLAKNQKFDVILANINRNVLLKDLHIYESILSKSGLLLLSGFYTIDIDLFKKKIKSLGLTLKYSLEKNKWSLLQFKKG